MTTPLEASVESVDHRDDAWVVALTRGGQRVFVLVHAEWGANENENLVIEASANDAEELHRLAGWLDHPLWKEEA